MSKKIIKKLCLALSIMLACSFVPSMMICSAEKSITQDLGEIEITYNNPSFGCPWYTFCREVTNANMINFTSQANKWPSSGVWFLRAYEWDNNKIKDDCYFSEKFNTTGPQSLIIEEDQLKKCKIDHFDIVSCGALNEAVKFKSKLTAFGDDTKDLIIKTPDKCSAASSLFAPIGAIVTTILGLLIF